MHLREGLILVVDDDDDTREAVLDLVIDAGYRGAGAPNGAEALRQLFAGLSPTVMLVDLEMPKMDGKEFLAACDAHPRFAGIPRMLVSGSREAPAAAQRSKALLMAKPVDAERLLRAIDEVSGGRARRSDAC
jgi:CheY-like chemotaxis protein